MDWDVTVQEDLRNVEAILERADGILAVRPKKNLRFIPRIMKQLVVSSCITFSLATRGQKYTIEFNISFHKCPPTCFCNFPAGIN